MTLESQIQNKINSISKRDVVKEMGYSNLEKAEERLNLFVGMNNIYLWLKLETFDSLYDSEDFVLKLLEVLELDDSKAHQLIDKYRMRLHQLKEMAQPYIDIDTKFKRTNEPLLDLVKARKQKRIMLNKEDVAFSSPEENLSFVQEIIQEHHNRTEADLGIWGKVHYYYFKNTDGNIYGFDRYGNHL